MATLGGFLAIVGATFVFVGLLFYGDIRTDNRLGPDRPGKSTSQGYTSVSNATAPYFLGVGAVALIIGLVLILLNKL